MFAECPTGPREHIPDHVPGQAPNHADIVSEVHCSLRRLQAANREHILKLLNGKCRIPGIVTVIIESIIGMSALERSIHGSVCFLGLLLPL